jgi:hypothetical protein
LSKRSVLTAPPCARILHYHTIGEYLHGSDFKKSESLRNYAECSVALKHVSCQLLCKAGDAQNTNDNAQSKHEHPKTSLNNRQACVMYILYGISNYDATDMLEEAGKFRLV